MAKACRPRPVQLMLCLHRAAWALPAHAPLPLRLRGPAVCLLGLRPPQLPQRSLSAQDRAEYWQSDGLHLTDEGYDMVGEGGRVGA